MAFRRRRLSRCRPDQAGKFTANDVAPRPEAYYAGGARRIGRLEGTSLASGRYLPRQSASKREVSGYLRHPDATRVLQTQCVKADDLRTQCAEVNVFRTQCATAKCVRMSSVRTSAIWALRVTYGRTFSRQMSCGSSVLR